MSNDKPKTKNEILSELDRLKELLEKDRFDSDDDDIPVLDEVVEISEETSPVKQQPATSSEKKAPATPSSTTKLPTGEELNKLVDTLVSIQMRKLRPIIQKEVVRLILERYPNLK